MEIFKNFGIEPLLLAAQIINFLILLWILQRFLYKPILKLLEERRRTIERSQKQTEEIQERLKALDEKEMKILNRAHLEARKIIEEAKEHSKILVENQLKEAKTEAEALVAHAQAQIVAQQEKMRRETETQLLSLITRTVAKVTGSLLTSAQRQKLTKEALDDIGHVKRNTTTS